MSNLLATLGSSAGALHAYDQVLQVTQNNVANASTPGYVKQRLLLDSMPFDLTVGAAGGVRAGEIQSARDQYAEQAVRRQTTLLGEAQQNVTSLTSLESMFDISGKSGIPQALNNLFESFSAWAQSPNDAVARQNVIDRATGLASAFQQTAAALAGARQDTEQQLQGTVDQVNAVVARLQGYNVQALRGTRDDPSLDAQVNSALEELSRYIDVTALQQDDGSVTVLLNGQTPLLVADRQYQIAYKLVTAENPTYAGRPSAQIVASDGANVTSQATGGQLGAQLDIRNHVLPSLLGDASQAGDLNRMAKQFADRVNQLLTPAQTGVALFTFDSTNATNVAQSLAVSTAATATLLVASDPGPPVVSNGVPLALSAMSVPTKAADQIDGNSFNQFFGQMASRIGSSLRDSQDLQLVQQSTVAQAKNLRQQLSGVSLDEEATILIQFQRAYDANSRLITVLDQITQDAINILRH